MNYVNKNSDYINKWHRIRQTISGEYLYVIHYMQLVHNIILLLNSIITSVSRVCKGLQQKHKTGVKSYKTSLKLQI